MRSNEVRRRFLEFFKKRGHTIIPSASLVPENDPSVLFNTAGMQPLVPYLMGRVHPAGVRLADVQKCLRTGDIDDVGDAIHLTFFEMLGNWSLGDYFKEDAIKWSYELLTSKEEGFGLDPKRLYITVFTGDENAPRDEEASKVWQSVGVPAHRIYQKGADANWWPAVKGKDTWTGPTGPCSEMFYDVTEKGLGDLTPEEFAKADGEQKVVEIWNDVFMEYEKKDGKIVGKLAKKNVDTGAGLERITAVLQKKSSVFDTDLFEPIMAVTRELTEDVRSQRIIADHMRASVFLIADGVRPSNTDQGYVLRRFLRRSAIQTKNKKITSNQIDELIKVIVEKYGDAYTNLNNGEIGNYIKTELSQFEHSLERGLKEFEKMSKNEISGSEAFTLFSSYGFPFEMTKELASDRGIKIDEVGFKKEFEKHQVLSRAGAEKKFKGGLADADNEIVVRYHTATHLLHQALRDVLGNEVSQKGSNITTERLRFDFAFPRKMTDEEKAKVEAIVNEKIKAGLPVQNVVLPKEEAEKTGALHFFGDKYGDQVSVYYIGDSIDKAYSKEFCGGPHVTNTGDLAGVSHPERAKDESKGPFKIQKEEAISAGVRRIKAVIQ